MKQECLASTTLADLLTPLHNAGIAAAVVERKVREWRDARRAKLAEAGARWFFFSALLLLGGDAGGRQLLGGDAGGRQSRRNRISGYRTATIGMSRTSRRPTSDAIQNGRLCCRNGPAEGRKCANFFRSSARAANATFRARRGRRPAVKQARRRWSRVCKAWARVPAGIANARARSVTAPIVNREPQKSTAEGRKCGQLFSVEREGGLRSSLRSNIGMRRELRAIVQPELVENVVQMHLHGAFGEPELARDLFVRKRLCDERRDFALPQR